MTNRIDRREFLAAGGAAAGVAAFSSTSTAISAAKLDVAGLKVDYIDRPLGLDNPQPRFSWRLESPERNVRQSAYRVLVAGSEAALAAGRGDLWDSGKIKSRQSLGIPYQGQTLRSRQRCWWCVQIWDEQGKASPASAPSWWEMGLLDKSDWSADWLAVEDAVAKADREFGLHWIWGEPSVEKSTRRFRFKFHLTGAARSGHLFAVLNDWNVFAQLTRIWLDGKPFAGPGHWIENIGPETGWLSREYLTLPALEAGDHWVALEINSTKISPAMIEAGYLHALALFVRVQLVSGETLRFGSGQQCKTAAADDSAAEWYTTRYDDTKWQNAIAAPVKGYQPWPPQPAMYLRREFSITQPIVSARLYATALGAYEARLNGQRVGDALLAPEVSQYARRVLYRAYDVTALLKSGANALGLLVGDGWYASFDGRFAWDLPPRRVLAQLELTLADGSRQVIASGPGWSMAASPIRYAEIRSGEIYDARLEQPGWDRAGFDDTHWSLARVGDRPACRLVAQTGPPVRATQTLKPSKVSQPKPGVYVFDFGQNFAGWCRLQVKGSRGTQVELRFAEFLTDTGEVNPAYTRGNMGDAKHDVYVLRGDASGEAFEPHFAYRGFRYVQVTGLPAAPAPDAVQGVVAHSDLRMTGRLRADSPLIEEIWRNTVWTQRSNFVAVPTDCPSREQRGWMGDPGIFWDAAAFNMDVAAFTARHMEDVVDEQTAEGAFPTVAPEPHHNNRLFFQKGSHAVWGDAGIILPWTAWQRYGDTAIIERHWEAMNRHLDFILAHNANYVRRNQRGLDVGDHLALDRIGPPDSAPPTSNELVATAYWAYSADLLAQMSQAIGRTQDAARLRGVFERVREAFNTAFVHDDGTVGNGTQTSQVLALGFGLLPDRLRKAAAERLASDVRQRGVSLTTGIVGTQFILDVLTEAGYSDLAYGLLLRTDYPSWGYMIRQGATTIWESWSGKVVYGEQAEMWSHNHFALGAVCGFMFRRIAGIEPAAPGFEKIIIRPVLDRRVKRGGGDYDSVIGRISTEWSQEEPGRFTLSVTLPATATARIHLPAHPGASIREGRSDITHVAGVRLLSRSAHEAVLEVGSGTYQFFVMS